MRIAGVGMACLTAVFWLGGGCQRSVVPTPDPFRSGGRWPETARVPAPHDIVPPLNSTPSVPSGNPWKPTVAARDWKHIVIHHTASEGGSVASIHAEHVNRKDKDGNKWLGIGYHFLIGNGSGMGDGEIEPTFRWKKQMHGAHAGNDEYNQHGIGICLVGNFQEHRPSAAQLASVKRLVAVLKREYGIKSSQVVGHRDVKQTACPGKQFPMTEIAEFNELPAFGWRETSDSILVRTQSSLANVSEGTAAEPTAAKGAVE